MGAAETQTEGQTERAAVRPSENASMFALQSARVGTWRLDLRTEELTTSETCRSNFGRDPALPFSYAELNASVHPDDAPRMRAAVRHSIASGAEYDIEYRLVMPAGQTRWVQIRAQPSYAPDGAPLAMAGVSIDVTARREAEAALRESERRYRTLFETMNEGFCVFEFLDTPEEPLSDYVLVEANAAYQRHAGLPGVVGRRAREAIPDEAEAWVARLRPVLVTGVAARFEHRLGATGRELEISAFRLEPPARRQVAVLFQDVTARKQAERALLELNETLEQRIEERSAALRLFEAIVRSDAAPVVAFDHDLRVIAFNPAHARHVASVYGRRVRIGEVLPDLFEGERAMLAQGLMRRALAGEAFTLREPFGGPGGEGMSWELSYNPLRDEAGRIVGAFHHAVDVTAQLRAEATLRAAREALRQSQKMEAMGQLTGGVAHDFNNLLTPIVGALDLLGLRGVGGERERRLIAGAALSAERARTLVQRLLAFARRQPLQAVAVDVARLVTGMTELIASTTGQAIRLEVDVPADLPAAHVDPNQLEMALLNLAVNARDAMPKGGTVRISAAAMVVAADPALQAGEYVRLAVADTGAGMDEATLARAAEPFFSTKGLGRGTGLGLSMVHGLASQLGGTLRIESQLGVGTTVALWLPLSGERPVARAIVDATPRPSGRGTALLVDDEALVLASTTEMLADLGYGVVQAASAGEALAILNSDAAIDVIVTDHLMPGMTGADLVRHVRATRPVLPALIVSGYAEADGIAPDLPRLTKPFLSHELAAALAALRPAG